MRPIAIFYHCILTGGSIPIDTMFAINIMQEQMAALERSGLSSVAREFHIGVNGDASDVNIARLLAPKGAHVFHHGINQTSEIPTLESLRKWLPGHEDWYVLYHHIKGVTHPDNELYAAWRRRMENAVVLGWRNCVGDMDGGIDSCGAHWLTPEKWPDRVNTPFWGGTFWWATAMFLLTLPPLPPPTWANRFEAEAWIGKGTRRPNVRDYYPGWP